MISSVHNLSIAGMGPGKQGSPQRNEQDVSTDISVENKAVDLDLHRSTW